VNGALHSNDVNAAGS